MTTFFVAHAYTDAGALRQLLGSPLPDGAVARVFPPVTVSADQRVSDDLIAAIRASDGLVYLRTKVSTASFWVAFERNYALRLGKPVYAFAPGIGTLVRDEGPAVDPAVAVTWNLAVSPDSFAVRDVALQLAERHGFDILGDKWQRLDNDFRQMMDSPDGLRAKIDEGGIVLLFLSNESICGGWHDYADPFAFQRAKKDFETPIGETARRFALLPKQRILNVWLDEPDTSRIEVALGGFRSPDWDPNVAYIRGALGETNKCIVRARGTLMPNQIDNLMVRTFYLATDVDPRFRHRLAQWPEHVRVQS